MRLLDDLPDALGRNSGRERDSTPRQTGDVGRDDADGSVGTSQRCKFIPQLFDLRGPFCTPFGRASPEQTLRPTRSVPFPADPLKAADRSVTRHTHPFGDLRKRKALALQSAKFSVSFETLMPPCSMASTSRAPAMAAGS